MTVPFSPKISIGLPVHNGERYLRETLLSLVSQDYVNLEIIVSDNASTDGTAEIIKEFASRYSSIRVITQTKILTLVDNFSFVLGEASGNYFCWAAADDIRSPGSITSMAAALDCHSELVCVMTDVVNLDEETQQRNADRLEGIRLKAVLSNWTAVRRLFFEVPTTNIFFCIYGLYRTKVVREARLNMNLGFIANGEIPFLAQVALKGAIASLEIDGFIYRRHSQSTYHLEVAGEGPEVQIHRNKVIRRVLRKMILTSSLPLAEKAVLLREQWREGRKDMLSIGKGAEGLAAARAQKRKKMKRKEARHKFLKRLRNRIRNRIFGVPVSRAEPKLEVRDEGTVGLPLSDEEMALYPVDPGTLSHKRLVKREEARKRLDARGWRFGPDKSISLLFDHGVTSVIDCGANCGQFVENLWESGWDGRVFSFEPLAKAYETLSEKAQCVDSWLAFPYALGEFRGEVEINVAGNSYSSSLLEFSDDFKELLPDASPIRTESIQIRRLDELIEEEALTFTGPILLKLDVQGFELQVMKGAGTFLGRVHLIQTEMAFVPSYNGAPVFAEVKEFLNDRGFVLAHLVDGHANHLTGELREVDGIFVNTALFKGFGPSTVAG